MFGKKQRKMDYIEAAGIKADEETSLANIRMNAPEIIRMYMEAHMSTIEFGTRMPAELVRKGNRLCANPDNVRFLMSFLRVCAKLGSAAILCRKRGVVQHGKQTTLSFYRLLT